MDAYHGISTNQETTAFQFYLDLLYKHRVDVGDYGWVVGPHSDYSPFRVAPAWPRRKTTKARDYVLTVFPSIGGSRAPLDARRASGTRTKVPLQVLAQSSEGYDDDHNEGGG